LLTEAAGAVQRGQGSVYALVGEAGLGKSRLLDELRDEWLNPHGETSSANLIEDRLVSFESSVPFGLIRRRICAGLGLSEISPSHAALDMAVARLHLADDMHRERARRALELLFAATGGQPNVAASEPAPPAPLDAIQFRHELVELVHLIWSAWLVEHGPGLYIIDDFQYADIASLEVLDELLPKLAHVPLLLVLAFRPEQQTAAWQLHRQLAERRVGHYVTIMLAPLDDGQTARLVNALLDGADLPAQVQQAMLDRADGNPLFAEEIVRSLIDQGHVTQVVDGRRQLVAGADLSHVTIPTTLQALMQERIDRLPVTAKQTLHVAAVIGRTFKRALLEAALDNTDALDDHLAALEHSMLIVRRRSEMGDEFQFQHALTWDAVYQVILHRQRRRLHRHVGEALERIYADMLEERLGLAGYEAAIAAHFDNGGEAPRAMAWYRRAGAQAAMQFAHAEALRCFTRALALLTDDDVAQRFEIVLERERVLDLRGERGAQQADLATLAALADALDDDQLRCDAILRRARFAEVTGDYDTAISSAQRVIELAGASNAVGAEALAHVTWGSALWHQGAFADGRAPLERALALARASGMTRTEADALRGLGIIAEAEGDLAGARTAFEHSLDLMRTLADQRGESAALNSLGLVAHFQRAFDDARRFFDQSLRLRQAIGDRRGQGTTLNNLGIVACAQGEFSEAQRWLEEALQLTLEINDREGESSALEVLGALALYTGDFGRAEQLLNDALRTFQEIGDQVGECEALANLSLLAHYQGADATAEAHSRAAVRLARAVGTWSGQVRALTCLGHALFGLGQVDAAEEAYRTALELPYNRAALTLAIEARAGMARIGLAQGARDLAQRQVDAIEEHLQHDTLAGAEDPIRVYLTCWETLKGDDDSRARHALHAGWELLQYDNAAQRHALLHNVPSHRALLDVWKSNNL
jgi:predicted ATPase